jgi:MFS family permease
MLATIAGPIATSLHSFGSLSWIATTYLIGLSVSQPLSGQISDLFGRRLGLVVALTIFAIGTLLCGLASKFWVLLLGRVVQGLGGGAVSPITTYIENDLVPIRSRGLIEGIGNIMYGITLAIGGIYGGTVQNALGWKWTFLIQVPVIVFDIALVLFVLKIPRTNNSSISRRRQIDFVGMIGLISSLLLFQIGMNTGGTTFPWLSAPVIICLVASAVGLVLFVAWESLKASHPLIPIQAMMQRSVSSSQGSSFFFSIANISIMYYVPVHFQIIGYSTGASGFRFIPLALCFALGSFGVGYLAKVTARYYYINLPVQACMVLGAVLLCTMQQFTPVWAPFVYLGLYGAGSGAGYVTRLMGLITSVDPKRLSLVQAATFTISNTGVTLGITIGTMIFQHLSVTKLQDLFKNQPGKLEQVVGNFEALQSLDGVEKEAAISVYLQATRGVFFMAMASLVLAAVASFCMQNNLLVNKPAEEASSEDSGEAGEGKQIA